MNPHRPDISVGAKLALLSLLLIRSVVRDCIISGKPHVENQHSVGGKRVGSDRKVVYFPIIF